LRHKCSGEFEILGPVDSKVLIVPTEPESEVHLGSPREQLKGQEVAAVELGTVGSERIELALGINTPQQPVAIPPCRIAANKDNIAVLRGGLALNP
jgi:hypothetical protein